MSGDDVTAFAAISPAVSAAVTPRRRASRVVSAAAAATIQTIVVMLHSVRLFASTRSSFTR
jgi:hypothetical protein